MARDRAPLCLGIYTGDPVACRALGLLLRAAGHAAECLRPRDGVIRITDGFDLLVIGDAAGTEDLASLLPGNRVPVLRLVGDCDKDGLAGGSYLRWPSASAELVRAIEAAYGNVA